MNIHQCNLFYLIRAIFLYIRVQPCADITHIAHITLLINCNCCLQNNMRTTVCNVFLQRVHVCDRGCPHKRPVLISMCKTYACIWRGNQIVLGWTFLENSNHNIQRSSKIKCWKIIYQFTKQSKKSAKDGFNGQWECWKFCIKRIQYWPKHCNGDQS